jgi:hypothetical protein
MSKLLRSADVQPTLSLSVQVQAVSVELFEQTASKHPANGLILQRTQWEAVSLREINVREFKIC